jgi:hypothetical protein
VFWYLNGTQKRTQKRICYLLIIHSEHDTSHSRVNSLLLFVGQISAALLLNINQNAESGTQ